jgi:hypothetical protein
MTRVPIVTSAGTSYVNVVVDFDVAADGTLTIASLQTVPSPIPLIRNLLAGTYLGPNSDGDFRITVAGPGVTSGGATEWSSAASSGASQFTYPASATWYAFGGAMSANPLAARLKAVGMTTVYGFESWGVTGDQPNTPNGNWNANPLIGVSRTGNAITFMSFTSNGVDQSQPVDQITYIGPSQ